MFVLLAAICLLAIYVMSAGQMIIGILLLGIAAGISYVAFVMKPKSTSTSYVQDKFSK